MTEQVCTRVAPLMVQVAKGPVAPSAKKLTVPVAKGPASSTSLTVAVHLVLTLVGIGPREAVDGLQLTVVVVGGSWGGGGGGGPQLGAPPVQAPAWQVSPAVHESPSSHAKPSGLFTFEH